MADSEPKKELKAVKAALAEVAAEVRLLRAQCDPPAAVENLSNALLAILGNAERVVEIGDDPLCPLLPWIVNRCKSALASGSADKDK